jgi:hypothetical protein
LFGEHGCFDDDHCQHCTPMAHLRQGNISNPSLPPSFVYSCKIRGRFPRAIVEAHGGRIWADSPVGAGTGAKICFSLPR